MGNDRIKLFLFAWWWWCCCCWCSLRRAAAAVAAATAFLHKTLYKCWTLLFRMNFCGSSLELVSSSCFKLGSPRIEAMENVVMFLTYSSKNRNNFSTNAFSNIERRGEGERAERERKKEKKKMRLTIDQSKLSSSSSNIFSQLFYAFFSQQSTRTRTRRANQSKREIEEGEREITPRSLAWTKSNWTRLSFIERSENCDWVYICSPIIAY